MQNYKHIYTIYKFTYLLPVGEHNYNEYDKSNINHK
jgi:hypothetical protein